ncbi:unnamed protein product [Notodromas monacha]|uniref:Uncharacterized protein n=1 Tax=Notodromas monacha TaxID=399045 RepID=A0A7R9GCQ2_9CRUS|nr:unnamed protein product [Notodromas monacha]CAG0917692.1 unnamed protein product [Notodromas monacha]
MAGYVGSRISLISNAEIRYEGVLYTIDQNDSTVTLSDVKSYGTEDRQTDRPVAARDEVYAYIIFRGSDIKHVRLVSSFPDDPAIVQHSAPPVAPMPQPNTLPPPIPSQQPTSLPPTTQMGIKLPFSQPPPSVPAMPAMSAPPPTIPTQTRAPAWDGLMPASFPPNTAAPGVPTTTPTNQSAGVIGSGVDFRQPPPTLEQVHPPQPPPRTFSAAVSPPSAAKKSSKPTPEAVSRTQPEKPRRNEPVMEVQIAKPKKEEQKPKEEALKQEVPKGTQPAKQKYEQAPVQQQPSHYNRQQQHHQQYQHRDSRDQAMNRRNDNVVHRNQQSYNDRRSSGGGGGYVQRNDGYYRGGAGGGYMGNQGYRGHHPGMRFGRGRGRGGLVGHLEPARQESRLKFTDDYDFETANAEFENVKSGLGNLSLNGPASSDDVEATANGDAELVNEAQQEDEEDAKQFYDKEKSFFDKISCEAMEKSRGSSQRPDWKNERKLNAETFGVSSVRRGFGRGYRRGMGMQRNDGYRGGRGGYRQNFYRGSRPRVPNLMDQTQSSVPAEEDACIKKLESFSLSSKQTVGKKKRRNKSASEDNWNFNFANRVKKLPPRTYLRKSKLDHIFKSKRSFLRASPLSKRSGSAPPENRIGRLIQNEQGACHVLERSYPDNLFSTEETGSVCESVLTMSNLVQTDVIPVRKSCSQEAANPTYEEVSSVDELAGYLENGLHIPKKMSKMAEMMYT